MLDEKSRLHIRCMNLHRSSVMRLKICRECEHYIMDDGREVSCRYYDNASYFEIRLSPQGAEISRCPMEMEMTGGRLRTALRN